MISLSPVRLASVDEAPDRATADWTLGLIATTRHGSAIARAADEN